ncbi:EAL domain-containing response regulator [Pseudomonas rhodesiae]|uniref:EAL domain-containing response regulator n=1 Tax=Pseudomonas rhodesiae TaxID=76760 RepID=UPI0020A09756|nr:EAL domain-containing response regulator [Pseudomonas rhodesiae]MCP1511311.1 EAL domain-containing protein (putative c-di-GMP-specific phosphodiesterase class I)/CheY-like chemotaxis protein [Pseudomonas rhodesiae]MDF9770133.1 EAL domain-containing protein (putative c-di-GMP-specific phosphodiesterase class I)/CheY-like chemotaxis protein [Pseudomonas rhodesiae]
MSRLPLRVLVLEDHVFQRSVAVNLLRSLGCDEVFEASDGYEALTVLDAVGRVDIALCDLQMEGMDGLEFLKRVGVSGQVKSIIISSSLPADLRRSIHQIIKILGLDLLGDVGKPLPCDVLRQLINRYLNSSVSKQARPEVWLATEEQVCTAIAEQQFQPWYQPKFNLLTGEVCGAEILCRWQHPTLGVVTPASFMPVLERLELIDTLLFAQLDQVLSFQRRLRELDLQVNTAFNLHASQLANPALVATIKGILRLHAIPASCLTFELTEVGLLEAAVPNLENLVRLRMMGCRLSIDDFGAGFSSLQRLCQLPFNEIKLDGEFIRTLDDEPRCRAVICGTLALGHALGMNVVIEGIETPTQRAQLLALGGEVGQGYLYARPMNEASFLQWLQRQPSPSNNL